jgi:xanthine/CO dehydrogenase XdhC/CoxF family maturation factor
MLCALYDKPFAYLGLLGPASKRDRLLREAADAGIVFSESQLQKLYGPTGLSIGAETAEQIAVSVIAEIMAVLNQAEPQHLRNRTEPIHFAG